MHRPVLFGIAAFLLTSAAWAQTPDDIAYLYGRFDSQLSSTDQIDWMKRMAAEPNHVGSPHDKINADWELAQFRKFGWDAHIETFQVLFPTPISEAVEMGDFKATLQEAPIPGDTSSIAKDYALPAYLGYQGDGDVTAPLVYVNYGSESDYKQLEQIGVSVKGKIVIARYGETWRGVKVLLAYNHGAIGCLIYSDPADDGYAQGEVYPKGPMRPPQGIQRGSAMDMMQYPGDPLTPGIGATANAKRLTRETAAPVLKIPALPISYADAQILLAAIGGPVAPENWRGGLAITYHVGGAAAQMPVHLEVKSNWDLKPVYDVIAMMRGSTYPDQWVIRANHHDGWVEGAADPMSGQVALLDEARAIGGLVKAGWKPKRTIVYASWDGEEPMALGSTEWAEQHADELKKKALIYINSDNNARGILSAAGNPDLGTFVTKIANSVTDPEVNVSVGQRARDKLLIAALSPSASPDLKADAEKAAKPSSNLPIAALGSGSDYVTFLDHLGVTVLNIGYGVDGIPDGVYHSRYDTFEHYIRFGDPGLIYGKVLAETVGHAVLTAADTDMPLQNPGDFAGRMAEYVSKVEKLANSQRSAAEEQKSLLAADAFAIAADPIQPHANPEPMKPVPKFDFSVLDDATANLAKSAKAYEAALAANGGKLSGQRSAKLQVAMQTVDQTLLSDVGLPGRAWYKNLVYAPGRYIGYGVTTLPGITESITSEQWDAVPRYIDLTAGVFNAYAARLDAATAILSYR